MAAAAFEVVDDDEWENIDDEQPSRQVSPTVVDCASVVVQRQVSPSVLDCRDVVTKDVANHSSLGFACIPEDLPSVEERRVDPEDNQVLTLDEFMMKYAGANTADEIRSYWAKECRPEKSIAPIWKSNPTLAKDVLQDTLGELSAVLPFIPSAEPPSESLYMLSSSGLAPTPWMNMPGADAGQTEQTQAWDQIYRDQAETRRMKPIWLHEQPRAELRRLLEEKWVEPTGSGRRPLALELGSGLGHDCLFLAEQGFLVTGLDVSNTGVEAANAEATIRGLGSFARFFVADAYSFAVPDQPLALLYDNTLLGRALCDPSTRQDIVDYKKMILRYTIPGSLVYIVVCSSDMAEYQQELREMHGIDLPRISAARLVKEFCENFEFLFFRKGVYDLTHDFCVAALDVGWREPCEIGGHPAWAVLMRRLRIE